MRKNINETKKQCMLTAVAGLTLLLVFGGTASGCSGCGDTKVVEDPKIEIEGGDLDFEFDPTKEITITPVPSGGEREEDPPTEVPDEDGNLPLNPWEDEDLTPTPEVEVTLTPTPTEIPTLPPTPTPIEEEPEPTEEPVEEPTLQPTPTPIEKDTTPIPTPTSEPTQTPIEKDTTPIPTPVEKDTTPAPTKEPEPTKFVEKKNPTLEEDGYTYEDPTDYKVGEVVGSVTPAYSGVPIDVIHHQPGDLFNDATDGYETNATYAYYGDKEHWVLQDDGTYNNGRVFICYGKLPEEIIKKDYSDCSVCYINEKGLLTLWWRGKLDKDYVNIPIAEAMAPPINTVVSAGVPYGDSYHGSFQ